MFKDMKYKSRELGPWKIKIQIPIELNCLDGITPVTTTQTYIVHGTMRLNWEKGRIHTMSKISSKTVIG